MDSIPESIPIFHGIGIGSEWRVVESELARNEPNWNRNWSRFQSDSKKYIMDSNLIKLLLIMTILIVYVFLSNIGGINLLVGYWWSTCFLLKLDKWILVGNNKIKTNVHDKWTSLFSLFLSSIINFIFWYLLWRYGHLVFTSFSIWSSLAYEPSVLSVNWYHQ